MFEGLGGTVCFLIDLLDPKNAEFPCMPCFEFSNENQNLDLYIDDTVTSKNIKANTEKIDKKKHTTDNNSIDHTNIENTNSESDKKEKTNTPEKETTMKTENNDEKSNLSLAEKILSKLNREKKSHSANKKSKTESKLNEKSLNNSEENNEDKKSSFSKRHVDIISKFNPLNLIAAVPMEKSIEFHKNESKHQSAPKNENKSSKGLKLTPIIINSLLKRTSFVRLPSSKKQVRFAFFPPFPHDDNSNKVKVKKSLKQLSIKDQDNEIFTNNTNESSNN